MVLQENQAKLFKGVVQFQPGLLQKGQGTGLGLYSKLRTLQRMSCVFCSYLE